MENSKGARGSGKTSKRGKGGKAEVEEKGTCGKYMLSAGSMLFA